MGVGRELSHYPIPSLARGHVTGEAGRLRAARLALAPAPDRFANAVSRVPPLKGRKKLMIATDYYFDINNPLDQSSGRS
jgi:hypothetical protein